MLGDQDGALAAELLLHMYRSTSSKDLLIMLSELQVHARPFHPLKGDLIYACQLLTSGAAFKPPPSHAA